MAKLDYIPYMWRDSEEIKLDPRMERCDDAAFIVNIYAKAKLEVDENDLEDKINDHAQPVAFAVGSAATITAASTLGPEMFPIGVAFSPFVGTAAVIAARKVAKYIAEETPLVRAPAQKILEGYREYVGDSPTGDVCEAAYDYFNEKYDRSPYFRTNASDDCQAAKPENVKQIEFSQNKGAFDESTPDVKAGNACMVPSQAPQPAYGSPA